ncbi:hypothetical protein [Methyloceanibacter stevinii]|uniref:hypothetical protein n=1 Tax=Methyloceanibacter stevinii TaxID=1774970 RepID=UPI0013013A73|nr:hypothetical protein [Methyloceanibacter stevinii]
MAKDAGRGAVDMGKEMSKDAMGMGEAAGGMMDSAVEGAAGMAKEGSDSAVDMGKEMTKDAMGMGESAQ